MRKSIELQGAKVKPSRFTIKNIALLYAQGCTVNELALRFKMDDYTINKLLEKSKKEKITWDGR